MAKRENGYMTVNLHPEARSVNLSLDSVLALMGALSSSSPLRCTGGPRLSKVVPSCYHQVGGMGILSDWELVPGTYKRLYFPCLAFKLHLAPPSSCNPSSSTDGPPPSLGFDGYGDGVSIEWPADRDGTSHLEDWLPSRKKERVHSSCAPSVSLPPHAAKRDNPCYFSKGPVSTGGR